MAEGYRFVDPCQEDFSAHYFEGEDGQWQPSSRAGEYSAARLRLNRQHLVTIRQLLSAIAESANLPCVDWNRPAKQQIMRLIVAAQDGL
ncbi:MAG: hypothetical protein JO040_11545 [Gemmatimonadetes bacterium]|nr:hypothetical protein [Gemmatimonadota bacterium]